MSLRRAVPRPVDPRDQRRRAKEADAWVVLPLYERGQTTASSTTPPSSSTARARSLGTYRKNVIPIMSGFPGVHGVREVLLPPGQPRLPGVRDTDLGITIGDHHLLRAALPRGAAPRSRSHGADVIFVPTATPPGKPHVGGRAARRMAIANLCGSTRRQPRRPATVARPSPTWSSTAGRCSREPRTAW